MWAAALPEEERRELLREDPSIAENWDEKYGDRINKIVFIGLDMDRPALTGELDKCLLTDDEMDMDWRAFRDDFPDHSGVQMEEQFH
jgi:hypothetical protein